MEYQSMGNSPTREMCPRPLYHCVLGFHTGWVTPSLTIISVENLRDPKVEVKEEIKEEEDEDAGMEESVPGHHVSQSSYRNPPERCPRSSVFPDSTQGRFTPSLTIIQSLESSGDDNIDVKRRDIRGGMRSME
ncbi:unnamed protein product [Staurois parvus]|uniref:Uncharacterized protein n=1 Tax=Staurois parvus TaxID=386267 RepID=A0ABN9BNC7_9NEOB|nr:unnamed protein product [Staurois parvus]